MPYKGHVKNGVIVLDEAIPLEEGLTVTVEITNRDTEAPETPGLLYEHYRSLIGALDGMPEDWAENHDGYLRERHSS